MKILAIETSCDETAISIIDAHGTATDPVFSVIAEALHSQIDTHREYGGVFPALAKREHMRNIPLVFETVMKQSGSSRGGTSPSETVEKILARNMELFELSKNHVFPYTNPGLDVIAVTSGPGLEPALWVGISFAQALGAHWNIPVMPVNHMKGHLFSVLYMAKEKIAWPAIALLVSGGHTELVYAPSWHEAEIIGRTRDDAAGEAFDKAARILGLPYPGGPEISRAAARARASGRPDRFTLPRPMIHSGDFDFSFSGLKTATLYAVKKHGHMTPQDTDDMARSFEDSAVETLSCKTQKALEIYEPRSLILAGGVAANTLLREQLERVARMASVSFYMPQTGLATDNATMIAIAGYIEYIRHPEIVKKNPLDIVAQGNLSL